MSLELLVYTSEISIIAWEFLSLRFHLGQYQLLPIQFTHLAISERRSDIVYASKLGNAKTALKSGQNTSISDCACGYTDV